MKIGIDIGGSHIGVGIIDNGKIISIIEHNFNIEDKKDFENSIIKYIKILVEKILLENKLNIDDINFIGIAAPGTISNGVIIKAGNLNIKNFDIINRLKKLYNIPIQIRNDAKCAAIAEKNYGIMKEYDDCVFINIGTGIGGAVFCNGKLLEPKRYSGFEFGHMILNKDGNKCTCGKKGCFETYCSIQALKNKVCKTLNISNDISGQYLRENLLILDNDGVKNDIEEFLDYLKIGIGNLIDIFEPEIVCLGGSFAYYEKNPVLNKLIEKLNEDNVTFNNTPPKIVTAMLKNNAGIIGAVL